MRKQILSALLSSKENNKTCFQHLTGDQPLCTKRPEFVMPECSVQFVIGVFDSRSVFLDRSDVMVSYYPLLNLVLTNEYLHDVAYDLAFLVSIFVVLRYHTGFQLCKFPLLH